ncbi:ubiquinol-cytochrome c reductase core subunit 1, partial [Coemansia sp. RSA 2603]
VVAADRVAVVATGVDAQQLARLIGDSALGSLPSKSSVTSPATQLTGGAHVVYESAAPLAHYALAFPCDTPQAVRPLAALLGASSRVKWGAGTEASLAHVASSKGFGVAPFAFAYSDAGLVGVVVSAARGQIGSAVRAVAESIQKHVAQPNDAQVGRAVAQASLDAAQQDATVAGQIEGLARAAFAHKQGGVLEAAHVKSLAKSVFSAGKPVAASVGLPQDTPYVDTLGF